MSTGNSDNADSIPGGSVKAEGPGDGFFGWPQDEEDAWYAPLFEIGLR